MDDINIVIDNFAEQNRKYLFDFRVPNESFNFHCKYQISVTQKIIDKQIKEKGSLGYIMVQAE
tara:strand:+ start:371 stop:559 length:189 start_codon:yes stop_codon:yes gene_type:complete